MEIDEEGLKFVCSHCDASVSGHGEFDKIWNSGTQLSIPSSFYHKYKNKRKKKINGNEIRVLISQ